MMTTASFKKENCSPQLAPFAQKAATPSRYSEFKIDSRGATRIAPVSSDRKVEAKCFIGSRHTRV